MAAKARIETYRYGDGANIEKPVGIASQIAADGISAPLSWIKKRARGDHKKYTAEKIPPILILYEDFSNCWLD